MGTHPDALTACSAGYRAVDWLDAWACYLQKARYFGAWCAEAGRDAAEALAEVDRLVREREQGVIIDGWEVLPDGPRIVPGGRF